MKINWGKGIVIAFVLFMSFILYFVMKVQTDSKYDNELVVEEYYKHDARYGEEMTQSSNEQNLQQQPTITNTPKGIQITFPPAFDPKKITGKVSLYRPSAKKLDFEIPIQLSGPSLLVPNSDFAGGRWDITLAWHYEGTAYIKKQTLYIN
ncbi:MAG: FixH family protein [Flavobacterium sp.]|nr:FixH family protein [Flavobacterium sp.]